MTPLVPIDKLTDEPAKEPVGLGHGNPKEKPVDVTTVEPELT